MLKKSHWLRSAVATGILMVSAGTSNAQYGGWGGWGGYHHHHFGGYVFRSYGVAYDGCYRKRWIDTPYGVQLRWVNVCAY